MLELVSYLKFMLRNSQTEISPNSLSFDGRYRPAVHSENLFDL